MKIILSPFSAKLRTQPVNPKNYPHWKRVIDLLKKNNAEVIQVGVDGEEDLGTGDFRKNLNRYELEKLVKECDSWISVDNFFHHFCTWVGKKGVVIFGKSDPEIFGHEQNINLLKSRALLRVKQFDVWEGEFFDPQVWPDPEAVCLAVFSLF